MKLFLLTALTMIAFAANSVLTRAGLVDGAIDPFTFAAVRLGSGAAMLVILVAWQRGLAEFWGQASLWAVLGLGAYMIGFSYAYLALDSGVGALILFGGVQITMFLGAVWAGKSPRPMQWLGSGVAFMGLVYLLAPGAQSPALASAAMMCVAAVGWGVYSLMGQKAGNPLFATAANFCLTLPIGIVAWMFAPAVYVSVSGVGLAILSGAVTSALGYALWYQVLGRISTGTAAVAQLSVPLIAAGGGFLLLAEPLTLAFGISAVLVLGGIAVSVRAS